ncbi:MAG: PilZ domain-containing protein [Candidatus Methylomirabilota bacterium]
MTSPREVRRNPRYETALPVKVIPPEGEPTPGTMLNVCRGGMLVALSVEVELDRTYHIEIPDPRGAFRLHGEALRLHLPRRGGNGAEAALFKVGFEFVGMDAAASQRLDQLLAEISA